MALTMVDEGAKVEPSLGIGDEGPTPDFLLVQMIKDITAERSRYELLSLYVEGNPPKPRPPKSAVKGSTWTDEFERFQKAARTNLAELVVGAALDRTGIVGFRTAAAGDEEGDVEADKMWDENDMDVLASKTLSDMYTFGKGYLLADPMVKRAKNFRPWQANVVRDSVGDPVVGLNVEHRALENRDYAYLWQRDMDDYGVGTGQVYLHIAVRDRDNRARRGSLSESEVPLGTYMHQRWHWWKTEVLDLDYVPLIDFENREGVGEFERHIDVLDRINHMLLQRVVIATMQAFKQRAMMGKFPKYDEKGNVIDYDAMFPSDPASLWLLPEGAEMWESGVTNIQDILASVKDDVRDLAAVTRTPMTYFSPDSANGSAEGASLQREGYTNKIAERKKRTEGRWRRFMSLMFEIKGDKERSKVNEIEVLWVSEPLSVAEKYSAAAQAQAFLPLKTIMREVLGFSPKQIRAAELERISQALTSTLQASQQATGQAGPGASVTPLQRNAAANAQVAKTNGATSRATGVSAS